MCNRQACESCGPASVTGYPLLLPHAKKAGQPKLPRQHPGRRRRARQRLMSRRIAMWMPLTPSTTCVTRRSPATLHSE